MAPAAKGKYYRVVKPILAFVVVVAISSSGCALRLSSSGGRTAPVSESSVRAHMEFLAGDALNGRGSGTRDEWIAAAYVAAQMRRRGLEPMGEYGGYIQSVTAKADARTWNAVGRLPGSDARARQEVILLSAHLDHLGSRADRAGAPADAIYNGADDDASGVIAVLELMEALATGRRPRRTIVFALFGSEERGGLGSRFFADQPTVPLTDMVANLQFEMIGRPDAKVPARTLWLTGYERSNLGPELARRGARLVQDPHPEMKFFVRSDNIEFARRGVIAHTVSSYGLHKEYHTPADDISRIDFTHMTDAIRSMVEPIRWLANASFKATWNAGMKP